MSACFVRSNDMNVRSRRNKKPFCTFLFFAFLASQSSQVRNPVHRLLLDTFKAKRGLAAKVVQYRCEHGVRTYRAYHQTTPRRIRTTVYEQMGNKVPLPKVTEAIERQPGAKNATSTTACC